MKKSLLILASAALLFAGCAKEQFADNLEGGLQEVTFTANLESGVATKAVADGDGNGLYVNRCIMEIYFGEQFYKRLVEPVTTTDQGKKVATFANVPVVAGKQYQVLFWADCGGAEKADLYYTTTNLKTVTVAKTAFLAALAAGENDKLDAFYFADNYTISQNQTEVNAVFLKRPFAQLNVITTDINKTVTSAALLPDKVSVSYKADNILNVATGETSRVGEVEDYTFAYEAPVYGDKTGWTAIKNRGEYTLSMDYILAPATEQGAVDVTFKTFNNGDANPVMTHNLTNLPYKRNYRTNVKGDLLTAGGSWTATIDAQWLSPDIVKVVEVADIKSANEIIEQYAETTNNLEVKFVGVPNDSGVPTGEQSSQYRAILTSPLKEGANLGIEVMTSTNTLYVGDYKVEYNVDELKETAELNAATVNINVPQNSGIQTLIINAPTKTVYVNGHRVDGVGEITNIDAITSMNTLIIEPGQEVGKLTMRQGGLEIHGTVDQAIVPDNTPIADINVRDCENLKESEVYDVLKPYIAEGYVGVKGRTTAGLWDIVPILCKIGTTPYGSLADAVAAVQNGETITLTKDIENTAGIAINTGKTFTIDFAGHKYIVNKPGAGSTSTETAAFQLLKGQTITFKNGTIEASEDNLTEAVSPAKNIKRMFQSYANITFEDMTIDGTNIYGNNSVCEFACGAVDIKGTTSITTGKQGVAVINVDTWKGAYPEGAQVTISSTGEFGDIYLYAEKAGEYTKSSLTIKDGKFGKVYGDDSGDWTASIIGGLFSEKPADALIPEGFAALENSDPKYPWKVAIPEDSPYVAQIGSKLYLTFNDALNDVQNGETIVIIKNTSGWTGTQCSKSGNFTIDFNGHTLSTGSLHGPLCFQSGNPTITLIDSKNGGGAAALYPDGGSSNQFAAVSIYPGNVTINGGNYSAPDGYNVLYAKSGNLSVLDANLNGTFYGNVSIYGANCTVYPEEKAKKSCYYRPESEYKYQVSSTKPSDFGETTAYIQKTPYHSFLYFDNQEGPDMAIGMVVNGSKVHLRNSSAANIVLNNANDYVEVYCENNASYTGVVSVTSSLAESGWIIQEKDLGNGGKGYKVTKDLSNCVAYILINAGTALEDYQTYDNLDDALTAATYNAEVTLMKDIAVNNEFSKTSGLYYKLDLNGHTITMSQLYFNQCANITLKDKVGGGKIISNNANGFMKAGGTSGGGTTIFESGIYEAASNETLLLNAYRSTVTINGGSFKGKLKSQGWGSSSSGHLVINDGFFDVTLEADTSGGNKSDIKIYGGKFKAKPNTKYLVDATCSDTPDADGYYIVTPNN